MRENFCPHLHLQRSEVKFSEVFHFWREYFSSKCCKSVKFLHLSDTSCRKGKNQFNKPFSMIFRLLQQLGLILKQKSDLILKDWQFSGSSYRSFGCDAYSNPIKLARLVCTHEFPQMKQKTLTKGNSRCISSPEGRGILACRVFRTTKCKSSNVTFQGCIQM